jgi:hypothetical protein
MTTIRFRLLSCCSIAALLVVSACATQGPGDDSKYVDPSSPLNPDLGKDDDLGGTPSTSSSGGPPATAPVCGDMQCAAGEDVSCASDCVGGQTPAASCGDGACDAGEDPQTCPQDCASQGSGNCGDGFCEQSESLQTCPQDCYGQGGSSSSSSSSSGGGGSCGDGMCGAGEDPQNCPQDCSSGGSGGGGTCAHSPCAEGAALAMGCDPCVVIICGLDDFCCTQGWDDVCVSDAAALCGCMP